MCAFPMTVKRLVFRFTAQQFGRDPARGQAVSPPIASLSSIKRVIFSSPPGNFSNALSNDGSLFHPFRLKRRIRVGLPAAKVFAGSVDNYYRRPGGDGFGGARAKERPALWDVKDLSTTML